MMSVMREIEDYVLDSPIALTSSYDKLVEKLRAALLARQQYHPQLVEVYQPQIVQTRGGERPRSPQTPPRSGVMLHGCYSLEFQ